MLDIYKNIHSSFTLRYMHQSQEDGDGGTGETQNRKLYFTRTVVSIVGERERENSNSSKTSFYKREREREIGVVDDGDIQLAALGSPCCTHLTKVPALSALLPATCELPDR